MPGSRTPPGRTEPRGGGSAHIAFRGQERVGTRDEFLSGLNTWPTCTPADASPPPSRTTMHGSGARRVASPYRVTDSHRLLLAGLFRRTLAKRALRRQTPKVGAVCGNPARTDLCGGRGVTRVPTAIAKS